MGKDRLALIGIDYPHARCRDTPVAILDESESSSYITGAAVDIHGGELII